MPPNDGQAAAGVITASGSAQEEPAVSHGAASPAEDKLATDGSPVNVPPVKEEEPVEETAELFGWTIRFWIKPNPKFTLEMRPCLFAQLNNKDVLFEPFLTKTLLTRKINNWEPLHCPTVQVISKNYF